MLLLSQVFLFEYISPFSTLYLLEENCDNAKSVGVLSHLNIPGLLYGSQVSVDVFETIGSDVMNVDDIPDSLCLPLESILISIPIADLKPSANFLLNAKDDLIPNDQINFILKGFFARELSRLAVQHYNIPSFSEIDQKNAFKLSKFDDCNVYFLSIDQNNLQMVVLLNNFENGHFIPCTIVDIPRPMIDLKLTEHLMADINLKRPASFEKMKDGVRVLEGSVSVKVNARSSFIARKAPESRLVHDAFLASLAKTGYYCLYSGVPLNSRDLNRGLQGMNRFRTILDLSNYVYLTEKWGHLLSDQTYELTYKSAVDDSFASISNLVESELLIYRAGQAKAPSIEDVLGLSESPAYLSISVASKRIESCQKWNAAMGLPALPHFFQDLSCEDTEFPLRDIHHRIELVFEVYTCAGSEKEMPSNQQLALEELKRSIITLIDDQILKLLMVLPGNDFKSTTIDFLESILQDRFPVHEREASSLPLESVLSLEQTVLHYTYELNLLDSECLGFMRHDLNRYDCAGKPIKKCSDFFYSLQKEDVPYFLTMTLVDGSVYLHFYCQDGSESSRSKVLFSVIQSIQKCSQRANQRFLLKELADSHTARDSLDTKYVAYDSPLNDSVCHQLGCVERLVRFFPVHWRLKPNQALNSIMSSLQALSIVNRRNMLIFSSSFYMHLAASPDVEDKPIRQEISSDSPNRSKDNDLEKERTSDQPKVWGITLHVFGLDAPSAGNTFLTFLNCSI